MSSCGRAEPYMQPRIFFSVCGYQRSRISSLIAVASRSVPNPREKA